MYKSREQQVTDILEKAKPNLKRAYESEDYEISEKELLDLLWAAYFAGETEAYSRS
jgi:hypothetical protein